MRFAMIGGDLRMVAAAGRFLELGHEVTLCGFERQDGCEIGDDLCCSGNVTERLSDLSGFVSLPFDEALEKADAVVLPLPASQDQMNVSTPFSDKTIGIPELVMAMRQRGVTKLFGGMMGKIVERYDLSGITVNDYYEREEFAIMNAIPTAEGAIAIAIEETKITLQGSEILVIGNGRIGKILAKKLSALGAKVTVSARRASDLAYIRAAGHEALRTEKLSKSGLENFDVIFNTVPSRVLGEDELCGIKPETLIIDLASKPGGVDIAAAGRHERRVIWALSLPGKFAPVSAGRIIADTIIGSLEG